MENELKTKGLTISEADREYSKDFKKQGSFTIRIPLPFEKTQIVSITSRLLSGAALNSIRAEDYEYVRMIATLDFVIVKKPDEWVNASECPNDNFLLELWKFYLDSERKFETKLKKN